MFFEVNSQLLKKILTNAQIEIIKVVFYLNYYNRSLMKKFLYLLPVVVIGCASPTAFMGNGIFSLGTTQSLSKAAVTTGADYVIKKRDRKK